MKRRPEAFVLLAVLLSSPVVPRAQEAAGPPAQASPSTAPPTTLPPPPAPAPAQPAPQPVQRFESSLPAGQWVYTAQYGWIWMPYGDAYTYVPASGYGEPYAYVYEPAYGWIWLSAPWIWGYGPWPYFGFYGAVSFGWYGRGYWREPGRWHWTGQGNGWADHRPVPFARGRAIPERGFAGARQGMERGGEFRSSGAFRGGGELHGGGGAFRGGGERGGGGGFRGGERR